MGVCLLLPVCVPVGARRSDSSPGAGVIGRCERPDVGAGIFWSFPRSWDWPMSKARSLAANSGLRIEGGGVKYQL